MPLPLALPWAVGAMTLHAFVTVAMLAAKPGLSLDMVTRTVCQAIGYLLVTHIMLRVYLPTRELPDSLALRRTNVWLVPLALVVGVAMQVPAEWLSGAIEQRWPRTEPDTFMTDVTAQLLSSPQWYRAFSALAISVAGPLVEEIFFRGALYRALRRTASAGATIFTTALLFSLVHADTRNFLPIMGCGLVLGGLREVSGSILISLAAHAAFNAVATFELLSGAVDNSTISWMTGLVGTVGFSIVLVITVIVGSRSELAAAAREEDAR